MGAYLADRPPMRNLYSAYELNILFGAAVLLVLLSLAT
jgi:hypothetical protein